MKMKRHRSESGQATTELAFMLLGFVILLLGLIFSLSLEIFNTRVLMDSKFQTEMASNAENASLHGGAGESIKDWEYDDGIPFSLNDRSRTGETGEMEEFATAMSTPVSSRSDTGYSYEWMKLQNFSKGEFKADFHQRDPSAVAAANLITRQGDAEGRQLTAKLPELTAACARLLGIRLNYDKLRNNPSNRVFMPANGEL